LGKRPDVELEGRGIVDLSVRAGADEVMVLVNNRTNPMMMKGPIREVHPIGPLTLSLAVREGRSVGRVHLVSTGEDLPFTLSNGRVRATMGELATLEAIQVDWN